MLISEDKIIPSWLKDNLEMNCPFCGSPYHVGYSPNGMRVTSHYCPNKQCPATVAMKMVFMWDVLEIPGIKYGKSMSLIKQHDIKNHLYAIPYVCKDKPNIDLATFMRINCIKGIDNLWNSVCKDKKSIEEVLSTPTANKFMDEYDKNIARGAVKLFNIVYPESKKYSPVFTATVMMTGDIMGISNRELFIHAMNQMYEGRLDLRYSKSIRKTGIYALIKEKNSPVTSKVRTALECGIPIMTPMEFAIKIDSIIKEKVGNNNDN